LEKDLHALTFLQFLEICFSAEMQLAEMFGRRFQRSNDEGLNSCPTSNLRNMHICFGVTRVDWGLLVSLCEWYSSSILSIQVLELARKQCDVMHSCTQWLASFKYAAVHTCTSLIVACHNASIMQVKDTEYIDQLFRVPPADQGNAAECAPASICL